MNPPTGETVLITGASNGIGRATALHLASSGYQVVATSRQLSRLNDLASEAHASSLHIWAYELDINDAAAVSDTVPEILGRFPGLNALVNNAGYGLWGCLEDLTLEEVRTQFETNVLAVLGMCQAVLPHMRRRHFGTIVNVGSISTRIGIPAGGAYSASKCALDGLKQSVAHGGGPVRHPGRAPGTRALPKRV